jgi:hypothetical protein
MHSVYSGLMVVHTSVFLVSHGPEIDGGKYRQCDLIIYDGLDNQITTIRISFLVMQSLSLSYYMQTSPNYRHLAHKRDIQLLLVVQISLLEYEMEMA